MKKTKAKKIRKLSLDDLKKKGNVHNETLEAISGGILGAGGPTSSSGRIYDGDKQPH